MASLSNEGHNVYKLTIINNEARFEQKHIEVNFESNAAQLAGICKILGIKEISFELV